MATKTLDQELFLQLCYYGSLAPSVHNTQPWAFGIDKNQIIVTLNENRLLKAGDPVGRQTWISIGACVENIVVAAATLGYKAAPTFKSKEVRITFSGGDADATISLASIKNRFTDRSRFTKQPIDESALRKIEKCWNSPRVKIVASSDPVLIALVSTLTARGISLALGNPDFRQELSQLITTPLRRQKVGIAAHSLRLGLLHQLLEPYLVKAGATTAKKAKKEQSLWKSSAALVLTFAKGDTPAYWLEAGQAYERAALLATQSGFRQSTSAAVVEAADYHSDIEQHLDIEWRLQTVMRIGHSRAKPARSPRLPVEELLT